MGRPTKEQQIEEARKEQKRVNDRNYRKRLKQKAKKEEKAEKAREKTQKIEQKKVKIRIDHEVKAEDLIAVCTTEKIKNQKFPTDRQGMLDILKTALVTGGIELSEKNTKDAKDAAYMSRLLVHDLFPELEKIKKEG